MCRIKYHVTQYEPRLTLILTCLYSGPIWCDCGQSQMSLDTVRVTFSVDSDLPIVRIFPVWCDCGHNQISRDTIRATISADPDLLKFRIFPVWCDCGHSQISRDTIRATISVDPDFSVDPDLPVFRIFPTLVLILTCLCSGSSLSAVTVGTVKYHVTQ